MILLNYIKNGEVCLVIRADSGPDNGPDNGPDSGQSSGPDNGQSSGPEGALAGAFYL